MTLPDFDQEVKRSPLLKVIGLNHDNKTILVNVEHPTPEGPEVHITEVPVGSLHKMPLRLLKGWLLGRPILVHVTRVVGYFSTVHNWNTSKAAELRDRQKGNYSLNGH